MSFLSAFTTQMVNFFEELSATIPEERDVKMACEAVKGAKRINPRLLLDLFYEHFYVPLRAIIDERNVGGIIAYAHVTIASGKFHNELMPALNIFDKHWSSLTEGTQDAIWKYLKVLCVLCEKCKGIA
jgi:hypothetical protein